MDPITISAIMSGLKMGAGLFQAGKGAFGAANNERPELQISDADRSNLAISKMRSQGNMPGYTQAVDNATLSQNNS